MAKGTPINYVEFYAPDLSKIKEFYSKVFGWEFTDYGPGYTSFENSGIAGGFEKSDKPIVNGALVVLLHPSPEAMVKKVIEAGGTISVDIFKFPGGRRFQFLDPAGNELGLWTTEAE